MAALKDRLRGDLTAAMKARDDVRTRTLRMALTSLAQEEVAGPSARELSDADVIKVLTREAKRRREAAEAFAAAGRADRAAAERAEGVVLDTYLPAQLSDEEIAAMVAAAIDETGERHGGDGACDEGADAPDSRPGRWRTGRRRGSPQARRLAGSALDHPGCPDQRRVDLPGIPGQGRLVLFGLWRPGAGREEPGRVGAGDQLAPASGLGPAEHGGDVLGNSMAADVKPGRYLAGGEPTGDEA
jgi:uncharacterized protein YqeY